MDIVVADFSGFCFGVNYTISTIDELLKTSDKKIHCIGQPVHNPQLTEKLVSEGLHVVESLDEIDEGVFVVRAHGLPPVEIQRAKAKGLEIVDTTCRIVLKAQNIAGELHSKGYNVVIVGEADHPEVKAMIGVTDGKGIVISDPSDCRKALLSGKIGILSQTTYSRSVFRDVCAYYLNGEYAEIRIFDTICNSVEKRCTAAKELANKVDTMLVIGGKMSSNTKRLFEACKSVNEKTYHIETINDLPEEWSLHAGRVGITAGASTPGWIINKIKEEVLSLRDK